MAIRSAWNDCITVVCLCVCRRRGGGGASLSCLPFCLSVYSNQLSQHDEKERLMEADSANSDLHICVVCMKSLMNTTVSDWSVYPTYGGRGDLGLIRTSGIDVPTITT